MWCLAVALLFSNPIDRAIKDEKAEVFRDELKRICGRESQCNTLQKVHPADGGWGQRMFQAAIKKGLLNKSCDYSQIRPEEWAPRGLYALSPPYHLHRVKDLTGECPLPQVLDDPYIATRAAIRKMRACKKCTCTDRLRVWAGPGVWVKKPRWHRYRQILRTCGIRALWDYALSS
jgi:hypothetical protein